MATAPESTPWRCSGCCNPALDGSTHGVDPSKTRAGSEPDAQVQLATDIVATVAMLALHEQRQLAAASQADGHTDLADQCVARHHGTVGIERSATDGEALPAGHVGVTGRMLPAQPDRQLCRIALAAAHIPAAAYADGADIERVLAALQHQRRA